MSRSSGICYKWYALWCVYVKNDGVIELLVNNEIQDKKEGIRFSVDLSGKLATGEEIKASLGGFFTIKCNLFIDNVLQTPVSTK